MLTRKRKIQIAVLLAIMVLIALVAFKPQDMAYLRRTKRELVALASDKIETAGRLAAMKKDGNWADGHVGIAADGYVFYYDLHESHGSDKISDLHLLYLPDEKRFLMNHRHFCYDINKLQQAQNKAEVKRIFWGW